jgi:hypothetical protein
VRFFLAMAAAGCLLALSTALPLTGNGAYAARAHCVAFCDGWCAKHFAMKNPTACSERCQLKQCK